MCFIALVFAAIAGWSPAIGAWLPSFGDSNNAWLEGRTVYIHQRDGFLYRGRRVAARLDQGPRDGTFFVYGTARPKGRVVYDPVHHIAFYGQGCCSWFDLVVAEDVRPPPGRVAERDLRAVQTLRGIRLGMSPHDVMHVYGRGKLLPVPAHPRVRMLAYTTWPPVAAAMRGVGPPQCGQFENFYFRRRRLVLIQLGNGC